MLYPSYEIVRKAKYAAYPDGTRVTEDVCEIDLQALLSHTASHIVASVTTVPSSRKKINSTLICKYGFDGSSGHSQYKQLWQTEDKSDEFLFMSSVVPLRLLNDSSATN
ncbi:hypothetical protein J437_LFUL018899 [Ladona fulva]|uniref:Uncharacterized protein n=1 Tax=Ladona fulva TaxID=123851 RepID=A0A8K0KUQ9_LADFU|nr:hypothetical protein J437_LFUL018899 [Ladona fulva]